MREKNKIGSKEREKRRERNNKLGWLKKEKMQGKEENIRKKKRDGKEEKLIKRERERKCEVMRKLVSTKYSEKCISSSCKIPFAAC